MRDIVNEGTPSDEELVESATPKSPILEDVEAWWAELSEPEQAKLRGFAKDYYSPMLDLDDIAEMTFQVIKAWPEQMIVALAGVADPSGELARYMGQPD